MRVEREVQVLSELGYRGATPVLEHMQVGLALILPTHSHTQRGNRLVHAVTTVSHLLLNRQVLLQYFSYWSSRPDCEITICTGFSGYIFCAGMYVIFSATLEKLILGGSCEGSVTFQMFSLS